MFVVTLMCAWYSIPHIYADFMKWGTLSLRWKRTSVQMVARQRFSLTAKKQPEQGCPVPVSHHSRMTAMRPSMRTNASGLAKFFVNFADSSGERDAKSSSHNPTRRNVPAMIS